jgi:hypothetical protein
MTGLVGKGQCLTTGSKIKRVNKGKQFVTDRNLALWLSVNLRLGGSIRQAFPCDLGKPLSDNTLVSRLKKQRKQSCYSPNDWTVFSSTTYHQLVFPLFSCSCHQRWKRGNVGEVARRRWQWGFHTRNPCSHTFLSLTSPSNRVSHGGGTRFLGPTMNINSGMGMSGKSVWTAQSKVKRGGCCRRQGSGIHPPLSLCNKQRLNLWSLLVTATSCNPLFGRLVVLPSEDSRCSGQKCHGLSSRQFFRCNPMKNWTRTIPWLILITSPCTRFHSKEPVSVQGKTLYLQMIRQSLPKPDKAVNSIIWRLWLYRVTHAQ